MRILAIHSDFIEIEPRERAIKEAEEIELAKKKIEECVVVFCAVEEKDEKGIENSAFEEISFICSRLKCNKIVLYPFVHLTSKPAPPEKALEILKELENKLRNSGYDVFRAPFGWYKAFTIKCKGHPLAELSREIKVKKEEKKKIEKKYLILTPEGKLYKPDEYVFKEGEEALKILVEKEVFGKGEETGKEPEYIKHMKKFGIEWEEMSDLGHMRFGAFGNMLFELVAEYSNMLAHSLGIPVYNLRGTNMFNLAEKPVREHAELFGDRLYQIDTGKRKLVMRYAACHQQFAILKDWTISYKHLPFGAFEVADAYRFEQSGELLLCFRCRKLHMPDLHVLCKDMEEAKEWFFILHKKIYEEMKKLGRDYVSIYNIYYEEGAEKFIEENIDFLKKLVEYEGKPALLCLYPKEVKYYWVLNIEYHIIDKMNRPREIGTVQIDIGNAKRFGIKYADKDGKEKYPIILHTAIIGTIERYLYTVFDTVLRKEKPTLPLWLSSVQVRLCPVNDSLLDFCEEIADILEKENIRVDIDDRSESVARKIRDAESFWVPLIVVVGEKEKGSGKLAVRIRETGEVKEMSIEELVSYVKERTKDYPFKPLLLPRRLSLRPVF